MHTDTTSQEYLIKLPIGGSDFSFDIETIVFHFNLTFNGLFCCTLTLVCNPQ